MGATCHFAECDRRATTDRGQLRLCADHAAEHDEFDCDPPPPPTPAPAPLGSPEDAAAWARWHERALDREGWVAAAADARRRSTAEAGAVCPRCLAAQYLPVMRTIVALPPSPDTNHAAHAAGFGIGALRLIAERPHAPCARHRGGG